MRVRMKSLGVFAHSPAVTEHFPANAGELTVKKVVGEELIRQGAATLVPSGSDQTDDETETGDDGADNSTKG